MSSRDSRRGHPRALARAAGPAGLLARAARAAARVAHLVLGPLGTALRGGQPALQRGGVRLGEPRPLVGGQQLVGHVARHARRAVARRSTAGRASPGRRRRGPGRCGSRPAARTAASKLPRTGASPRWWRARPPRGSARRATPGRASAPATGSSRPSTAARRSGRSTRGSSSMMSSRVQRVTRRHRPRSARTGSCDELRPLAAAREVERHAGIAQRVRDDAPLLGGGVLLGRDDTDDVHASGQGTGRWWIRPIGFEPGSRLQRGRARSARGGSRTSGCAARAAGAAPARTPWRCPPPPRRRPWRRARSRRWR